LTAHITAPIIHAGFSGKITLEIVNHGPFELHRSGRE
jgi:deoxycytidine triphosphate deaminase